MKQAEGDSQEHVARARTARGNTRAMALLLLACAAGLASMKASSATAATTETTAAQPTLEETRLVMDKWIETQQIIAKERNDWQQGKEILTSRLSLVKEEITTLKEKTKEARTGLEEANRKRDALELEQDQLKACGARLAGAVAGMEDELRRLYKQLPDPIQTKLQPLYQRIPQDASSTRVSAAERFQNVLGILNELNQANNEITVNYEVHALADGRPAEVRAIYIGLAQAYYVSAGGQGGVGRPTAEGWKWEPLPQGSRDIVAALEILQGKQTPSFVALPVKLQ